MHTGICHADCQRKWCAYGLAGYDICDGSSLFLPPPVHMLVSRALPLYMSNICACVLCLCLSHSTKVAWAVLCYTHVVMTLVSVSYIVIVMSDEAMLSICVCSICMVQGRILAP